MEIRLVAADREQVRERDDWDLGLVDVNYYI